MVGAGVGSAVVSISVWDETPPVVLSVFFGAWVVVVVVVVVVTIGHPS